MTPESVSAPVRHLVVLGHPSAHSFNAAVAETYCASVRAAGQTPVLRDLYRIGFDPVLKEWERSGGIDAEQAPDVAHELEMLRSADQIILIYPIWFGMPPAIIKGYVDRVLGAGFRADTLKAGRPHPVLAGKPFATFSSSATTRQWLDERGQWESMRQAFDRYLVDIFGMRDAGHTHFDAITDALEERTLYEHLEVARQRATALSAGAQAERHAERTRAAVRHQKDK